MNRLGIIVAMGLRNLLRSRRRTLSTLVAIAVGLLGLTLLDGFVTYSMNGFRDAIIRSGTGHIQLARSPAFFDDGDSNPFPYLLKNASAIETALRALPEVGAVLPSLSFTAVISVGGKTGTVEVQAFPIAKAHSLLSARTILAGRDLSAGSAGGILIGSGVAERLGLHPGDTVSLFALSEGGGVNTESSTVAGITSSAIAAVDAISVSMSLADAQALLGVKTVPDLILFLKRTGDTERVMRKLSTEPPSSPLSGLAARSWEQLSPDFRQANSSYQMILGVARLIVLIVALFSISGTLSLSVVERYREIGTLRAFGTKQRELLVMLVAEGIALAIAGLIVGSLLGGGISGAINSLGGLPMAAEPGMSTTSLAVHFTPNLSHLTGNGGWILLASLVGALFPWTLALRRSVAELLRAK